MAETAHLLKENFGCWSEQTFQTNANYFMVLALNKYQLFGFLLFLFFVLPLTFNYMF